MRRREFIAVLGGSATWPFTRPLAAEAQRRVGVLSPLDNVLGPFREGLATFGWVEGRNLRIDYRISDPGHRATDAEELVNLRPDVIFAYGGVAAVAVQQYTSVIPIVFMTGGDPSSNGLVRNIARPEGNVTGFAGGFGSQGGRWLELFKEAVPRLTRVADISFPSSISAGALRRASIAAAAVQHSVTIIRMPLQNELEMEHAISAFAAEPSGGLLLTGPPSFPSNSGPIGDVIARLALYHHLPLMYGGSAGQAERDGFLLSHGPDFVDLARGASSYVDRILRGAKPSELPVQFPTKFELVVNLKTAKAIGVTIPEAFLAQADQVIE